MVTNMFLSIFVLVRSPRHGWKGYPLWFSSHLDTSIKHTPVSSTPDFHCSVAMQCNIVTLQCNIVTTTALLPWLANATREYDVFLVFYLVHISNHPKYFTSKTSVLCKYNSNWQTSHNFPQLPNQQLPASGLAKQSSFWMLQENG